MYDDIDLEVLGDYYRNVNRLVGTDSMLKIFNYYKGSQITIPMHLYDRNLVSKKIVKMYNGNNTKYLANKYGYTEKWVSKIISNSTKNNNYN
ncbi:Mor transcription activator family protein [Apilactobacillus ozensis]|uniref:Mor transcription activator family protein n=1 Tax=Apilactobacillus ozensis TaxID=866801 RepID=UPI00200B32F5|nr:Mor transcription activator family protein [Apilactobacillus ozensis]MCK8607774.1 hypothetical protein [Apilactobacillus ozensis]